jgi:lipopolysaccharide biosynthesis protein
MKILAMYLPQYHTFKENDEWWGKGFTEWTNTKKAKPLYKNHYQPKTPLGENYYDLSNNYVLEQQSKLAQDYGIYGFVYYHYWFNGKKLMEKPLENMLSDDKVTIHYCLSWANEPWTRSWDGKSKEIIMPQEYGNKEDWETHFNYLLNFFKDNRYIKMDNKPVLFIYRIDNINYHEEMFKYWNDMAIKNGFSGIFIVETLTNFQTKPVSNISEAIYLFEPMYTTANEYTKTSRIINCIKKVPESFKRGFRYIKTNDYDMICKKIINRNLKSNKKIFMGFFPGWDNTARKGNKGSIIEGSTPEKFKKYLFKLIKKANVEKNDFVIINAWNEWAEGAYLEPDTKNEYKYLDAIKDICIGVYNG